jgi:hypothetical protein
MAKSAKKKTAKKVAPKEDITLKVNGSFADVIGVSVGKKAPKIIPKMTILNMKLYLLCTCLFISSIALSQFRKAKSLTTEDFCGTWVLVAIQDVHTSDIPNAKFSPKTIKFTLDSVYITVNDSTYKGTWKLDRSSFNIKIAGTDEFDYSWFSGNIGYDMSIRTPQRKKGYERIRKVNPVPTRI